MSSLAFNAVFSAGIAYFLREGHNDFWKNAVKLFALNWTLRVIIKYEFNSFSDYLNERIGKFQILMDYIKSLPSRIESAE